MSPTPNLRLALAQMTSVDRVESNLSQAKRLYERAAGGSDLVVFPENSLYFRLNAGSGLMGLEKSHQTQLQSLVDQHGTALMLTTAVADGGSKFRNSTWLFEPGVTAREVYSKIHLFDVNVQGAPAVRESEHFVNGSQPALIEFKGWKLGLSICYDVRFSELYLNYAQKADLILVPSAFLVPTGEAHWHVLLRARAIEAQCYVAAPAQSGDHVSEAGQVRRTFGHSLAVDPWGKVLLDLQTGLDVGKVELSRQVIDKVRQQIPMSEHRRLMVRS